MGFGGYAPPPDGISGCQLCQDSTLKFPTFWPSRTVPTAGTEQRFTA